MSQLMVQRAERLEDAWKTISPTPLLRPPELTAFYRPEMNELRKRDIVQLLKLRLDRSWKAACFHGIIHGHSGVGKSTEMTRLESEVADHYRAIRFSITKELNAQCFAPFDVLMYMMAEVAERTARPVDAGGAGVRPPEERLREIWDWFAVETETVERATQTSAQLAAGAGVTADSWWGKLLGLFGSVKGELQFAASRKKETVAYRLSRLDTLIRDFNRLVSDCNSLLREKTGREWLFIVEDFDKSGVAPDRVEDLLINYSNVLRDLDAHWIVTVPPALRYSGRARELPAQDQNIFCITDAMVFTQDHQPHTAGRNAVRGVLEARINPRVFSDGQIDRLVIASGGNLRDLFTLTLTAVDEAIIRGQTCIGKPDVDQAIVMLRTEYERQLGQSVFDREPDSGNPIAYESKAAKLKQVYSQDEKARVPDAVLYSLLRSRAVQEFNGDRWFGVHPLVVDILARQGELQRLPDGTIPGGTR